MRLIKSILKASAIFIGTFLMVLFFGFIEHVYGKAVAAGSFLGLWFLVAVCAFHFTDK
jgi:hypothetical protein